MSMTLADWQRLWRDLGLQGPANGGLMNQLLKAWGEPQRRYHTLVHLRDCLAHAEAAAPLARRPAEVQWALWFHDAVYDPVRADNEQRSADWARAALLQGGGSADAADRVHALVMATAGHGDTEDPDTQLLLDIDLAILGTPYARFDAYEREVRAEYAHVDEAAWRAGRGQWVRGMLARPSIFRTAPYRDSFEARARENLARSLRALEA
jgi:predicted metal-dependent HD superfamily phosphohydrolase